MSMGDERARETLKALARLKNLALGAFAAIDQKTIFVMRDDM